MSSIIPTSLYAELTPNPATVKFVADRMIAPQGVAGEFLSASEAKGFSELATELFSFPFVSGIYIVSNFVTVTNNGSVEWDLVNFELREFIRNYLLKNQWAIEQAPAYENEAHGTAPVSRTNMPPVNKESWTDTDFQIADLIEEYVKPAVESDGGAIEYKSFKDGRVTVILRGSCSGCPSSSETLKNGIENLLQAHLPEVQEVVAEEL